MFEIILKNEDTLNVKLKPPAGCSKSVLISDLTDLTESFKRLIHSGTKHCHVAQRHKTVLWLCLDFFFLEK